MVLPDIARSRALLIGTSRYADSRLHDLPAVHNNLIDLRATLTGVFAERHLTVVEDPTDDRVVVETLSSLALEATDVLFVYYAGHGVLGTRQHELYFGLSSTKVDKPQYSALSLEWVRNEIRDSPAKTKVLILDSCFSGRAIEDFMADEESLILGAVSVSGTYTLASSSANVASLAPPGARHTAFTGELLDLLRRGIPAGPPELDLHLIYRHLHQRMTAKGWPVPRQRGTDNVHGLALGANPIHEEIRSVELPVEPSPVRSSHFEANPQPHDSLELSTQPASPNQAVWDPIAKRDASSGSGDFNKLIGTIMVSPVLFMFGVAARSIPLAIGESGLGLWNYFALLVFTIVILFVLLGLSVGLADEVHPIVASLVVATPLIVGFLMRGHNWNWVDAFGVGLAHLFTLTPGGPV